METALTAEEYYVKHINGGKPLFDMADRAPYYRWLESQFRPPAVCLDGIRKAFENKFGKAERLNPIFNFFASYLSPLSTGKKVKNNFWCHDEAVNNACGDNTNQYKCTKQCDKCKSEIPPIATEKKVVEDWEYFAKTFHRKYRNNIQMTERFFVERLVSAIKEHTLPISDNKEGDNIKPSDSTTIYPGFSHINEKDIKAITDEDAIALFKLLWPKSYPFEDYEMIADVKLVLDGKGDSSRFFDAIKAFQYLKSRGYI